MKYLTLIIFSILTYPMLGQVIETGKATYYADSFEGRKTANGQVFRQSGYTAAHRTIPLGTRVRVIRSDNNKAVTVLVNDRCADHAGGIIDLSKAAATELGFIHAGKTSVKLELIDEGLSAEELANARYTVQIAAAPTVEELYPTLSALSEKGYANITLEYTSQTTPPEYQIIMGPYKNKGNAELLRTAFSRENFSAKVRDKDAIK